MNKAIPAPARFYLIRHGETEWSLSGRHTGRTDLPLTARGEDEARELARRLGYVRFAHVLTSPLQRARRTCELSGLGAAAAIEPDLVEWDYGDYEGQRSVDIRKQHADWDVFRDGCPHGETPAQVSDRADRLIAHLRALDGNVALFSHGQFSCVLATRWIGLPLIEARHFALGTASLSILDHDPHHPEVAVIALWNAASSEKSDRVCRPRPDEDKVANPQAIARWENEGGELPLGAGSDLRSTKK
ncbi:MAG: histidine phosphatase family protein [Immundisolibacter sp.]|uniref:histidine phosphatase family protein n=1 Tax=Immundisolibacter sp. TaxID=1934948 RepID=UPI003EDE857A